MPPSPSGPRGPDYYKILQVDPEADPDIIGAAYRKLAQRHHPDVTDDPVAHARMTSINAAWEILRDPARRAAYDRDRRLGIRPDPDGYGTWEGDAGSAPTRPGSGTGEMQDVWAGPPPGNPSGTVLAFGRYRDWSLGEVARRDPDYLEWLERAPIGRQYQREIGDLLRRLGRRR